MAFRKITNKIPFVYPLILFLVQVETDVFYVSATKNAMEQFSRIFGAIPLPAILKSTRPEDIIAV